MVKENKQKADFLENLQESTASYTVHKSKQFTWKGLYLIKPIKTFTFPECSH